MFRLLTALLMACTVLLTAACSPPDPGVRRVLTISAEGSYTFNGVPVTRQQLPAAIADAQQSGQTLFAEIVASPKADMAAVQAALDALKAANARFAFIDAQLMQRPQPPQNQGAASIR